MKSIFKINQIHSNDFENSRLTLNTESYANFFKVSFDIGYFTFIIPFRFTDIGSSIPGGTGFAIHKNVLQQVVCGISHILILLLYFTETRHFPSHKKVIEINPPDYFLSLQSIASLIYKVIFIKILWIDQNKFIKIMDYLTKKNNLPFYNSKTQSKVFIALLCITLVILAIVCQIFGFGIIEHCWDWSPSWVYKRYVETARFTFFLSTEKNNEYSPDKDNTKNDISTVDVILTVATFIGYFFRRLFGLYTDNLILMACLTLYSPVQGFKNLIPSKMPPEFHGRNSLWFLSGNLQIERILKSYDALKELSFLINDAMGVVILMFIMDNILFDAIGMAVVIITPDWLYRVVIIVYFGLACAIVVLAGEICKHMDSMLGWLSVQEDVRMNDVELIALVNDVHSHAVAIRGDIIVLDYPCACHIISVLITFSTLCIQTGISVTDGQ